MLGLITTGGGADAKEVSRSLDDAIGPEMEGAGGLGNVGLLEVLALLRR